ncbi:MAG: glycosyltransferase [Muribaculum sp.]|nr:glycosyltransferase [Muribaculum sp.]
MIDSYMVSVIIPVWNVEEFLDECLESVAVQTYGDFEVVMVDDGSTDGSAEICRKWEARDKRFRLVQKDNGGLSSARNTGLMVAEGEYVAFVDSDDVVHPKYLEILVGMAERRKYYVAGGDMLRFSEDIPVVNGVMSELYHYLPEDALKDMLYQNKHMINSACGKLFSRECIEGIWFKEGILYEDLEWMARVLERIPKSKRVGMCNAPLYFYRKRVGSLIETFSRGRMDVLDVTREIEERAVRSGNRKIIRAARDRRLSANFDIYMQLWKYSRKKNIESNKSAKYVRKADINIKPEEFGKSDGSAGGSVYDTELEECWAQIKRLRMGSLFNPCVRRKNKLGVLLSFLGPTVCGAVGSRIILRLKK